MVATSSTSSPLIVVVGATGAQGGSVVNHLIASKNEYRIRGITRDPAKANAKELSSRGVEVVKGDLADGASIKVAFKNADYVFGLTNFWETMDPEKEVKDGKLLVDSAKEAGVKLFLWSGLEPVSEITRGKHTKVYHFDTKASISKYAKESGLPTSVVEPGFYLTNFTTKMKPHKQEDGSYLLTLPIKAHVKLAFLWAEKDYGAYVLQGIERGAGSEVLAASEYITVSELTSTWSKVSGKTIKHVEVSDADFEKMVPQGGSELVDMLRFFEEFDFGGKDIAPSQKGLTTSVHTFEQFAKAQDWDTILA